MDQRLIKSLMEKSWTKKNIYPLFCRVCRINLNSNSQAGHHFNGKKHRKMYFHLWKHLNRINTGVVDQKSPSFCHQCNVGFNSCKQAEDHVSCHLSDRKKVKSLYGERHFSTRDLHVQQAHHHISNNTDISNDNNNDNINNNNNDNNHNINND